MLNVLNGMDIAIGCQRMFLHWQPGGVTSRGRPRARCGYKRTTKRWEDEGCGGETGKTDFLNSFFGWTMQLVVGTSVIRKAWVEEKQNSFTITRTFQSCILLLRVPTTQCVGINVSGRRCLHVSEELPYSIEIRITFTNK